jgi:hypothetical protein
MKGYMESRLFPPLAALIWKVGGKDEGAYGKPLIPSSRSLRGRRKPFRHPIKTPLVLCALQLVRAERPPDRRPRNFRGAVASRVTLFLAMIANSIKVRPRRAQATVGKTDVLAVSHLIAPILLAREIVHLGADFVGTPGNIAAQASLVRPFQPEDHRSFSVCR